MAKNLNLVEMSCVQDGNPVVKTEGKIHTDNEESLEGLYQKYRLELVKYVQLRFSSGPPEPEDVVHSAYSKLASRDDLGVIKNPRAFLYTMTRNIVIDFKRKNARQAIVDKQLEQGLSQEISGVFDPETVLIDREEFQLLAETIKKLPPKQRSFLVMNRLDGLSYAEIGRRAKMSRSGVQKIVEQAVVTCMIALDREGPK